MLSRKLGIFLISSSLITVLILLAFLFPPPWLISILSSRICPNAIYFGKTNKPIIALTIDDSPDVKTTSKILDVLNKYQITATFFPISNNIQGQEKIIQKMVREGHEIGNHLTKDEASIKLGDQFATELQKAHKILSDFTTINWLRPGGGWCNQQMVEIAQENNYKIALGSVWSYDTHINSSQFATWFILKNTRPGSIIILHDIGDRGIRTIATLETIIPTLQAKGYQFVTLSELINNYV